MLDTTPFTMRRRQLAGCPDRDAVWNEHDATPVATLTSTTAMHRAREISVSPDLLDRFDHILAEGPRPGETYGDAAARKEREVIGAIAALSAADALHLQRLIESGDVRARAFERLSSERRQRILRALQRYRVVRAR